MSRQQHADAAPPAAPPGGGSAPRGWYEDPWNPDGVRWWSGKIWTGFARTEKTSDPGELETAGYLLAIALPFIGIMIGIVVLARNRVGPGLAIVVLSVLSGVVWRSVLA